jgi:ribonuclease D
VERFFDVRLEKAYTRSDWSRRPLGAEQLDYCYQDVAYLVPLMDIQHQRLRDAELLEEAQIEFERLALREAQPKEFDPHGWVRIRGSRDLSLDKQGVLAALFVLRDRIARRLDRPPFKVLGNDTLLRLAQAAPRRLEQLRQVKGVSSYVAGRMGRDVLVAVQQGLDHGEPPERPRPPRRAEGQRRMDMQAQQRFAALKDWRSAASQKSGVTTMAILPNYAMSEVARLVPRSLDELAGVPGVGRRRAERWGKEILEQLR